MQGKHAIFAGLAAGILFAVILFTIDPARAAPPMGDGTLNVTPIDFSHPTYGALNVPDLKGLNMLNATHLYVNGKEVQSLLRAPAGSPIITVVHPDGTVDPRPLSAVVVTSCGLAVALYIQLDATHLLRADPRQSDMFTAVDGKQRQDTVGPMKWDDAFKIAQSAVLSSNVLLPCNEGPVT